MKLYKCTKCAHIEKNHFAKCPYCGLERTCRDEFRIDYEDSFGELHVQLMLNNDGHILSARAWNTQDVRVNLSEDDLQKIADQLEERKDWP